MSRQLIYLLLAMFGTVLPWVFFADFFASEGLGGDFVGALFANGAAGGFSSDLLISSVGPWMLLSMNWLSSAFFQPTPRPSSVH